MAKRLKRLKSARDLSETAFDVLVQMSNKHISLAQAIAQLKDLGYNEDDVIAFLDEGE